jgi:hypothetical protein
LGLEHEANLIPNDGFRDVLPEGCVLEVEPGHFVILGALLGEGGQSRVYEIANCSTACIKIGRNSYSAKQLRREVIGYPHYRARGILCPKILGADSHGRFIIKEKFPQRLLSGTRVLHDTNRLLPIQFVRALREYTLLFEKDGIAVDCMPDNVIFSEGGCGSYETTTWDAPPTGTWTFAGCFLLEWLPWCVCHRSANGWPPFFLTSEVQQSLRAAWKSAPEYSVWREVFGKFPDLCTEWCPASV